MQNYIFKGYRITKENDLQVKRKARRYDISGSQYIRNLINADCVEIKKLKQTNETN